MDSMNPLSDAMGDETSAAASRRSLSPYPNNGPDRLGSVAAAPAICDRLVRHPQRQAAAPPKPASYEAQFLILNFIFPK